MHKNKTRVKIKKKKKKKKIKIKTRNKFNTGLRSTAITMDYIKLYQDKDYTNPKKLLIQIILLQVFYYLSALIIFYIVALLNGYEFSIDWIFQWQLVSFENTLGLTLFVLWLFDSLMCVLFVTIIVGRSKLAWDFAVTIHIINLIITWCYVGKFPTSMLWWMLQVVSAFLLVTLSTYSTRWKELRVTFFTNMLETRQPETVELEDMNRPS